MLNFLLNYPAFIYIHTMKSILPFLTCLVVISVCPAQTADEKPLCIIRNNHQSFLLFPDDKEIQLPYKVFQVLPCQNGYMAAQIKTKDNNRLHWAYLSQAGDVALETEAQQVGCFQDGLAWIMNIDSLTGNQFFQFIDTAGKRPFGQQYVETGNFSEGMAYVADVDYAGYIDRNGRIKLLLPQGWMMGEEFQNSLAVVCDPDFNRAVIDHKGNIIIPPDFTNIFLAREGPVLAVQFYDTYLFSRSGKNLAILDGIQAIGPFSHGLAPAEMRNKVGYIDQTGEWSIKPQFDGARQFSENLAAVQVDGLWGFIDPEGNWMIEPRYPVVGSFKNGLAYFFDPKNETGGYLDSDGQVYLQLKWEVLWDLRAVE